MTGQQHYDPSRSPTAKSSRGHHHSSSSDFGDFHSAPVSKPGDLFFDPPDNSPKQSLHLTDNDLLGSFEDVDPAPARQKAPPSSKTSSLDFGHDLLTEEPESTVTAMPSPSDSRNLSHRTSKSSLESSPSRSRFLISSPFPGPSSPPRVSESGSEILFHAPSSMDEAATQFRRLRRLSNDDFNRSKSASHPGNGLPHSQHSLLDALATTKVASRWKRSVLNPLRAEAEPPSKTAVPIDVSHNSPFASVDQIAGRSYVAPSGAPGFRPASETTHRAVEGDEWANTRLEGRRDTTEPVLTTQQAQLLRPLLPARQRLSDSWRLLFSLDQHGASLSTLYRLVEVYARTHRTTGNLLVVKDTEGHLFGVFLNEPILRREGTYYGSGESFMFKFVHGETKPRVFRWTGRNQYIALCESNFISFGGGGTSYGLLLDSTFSRNSSATSPAFQNEVLCGDSQLTEKAQPFDCLGLEVWATS